MRAFVSFTFGVKNEDGTISQGYGSCFVSEAPTTTEGLRKCERKIQETGGLPDEPVIMSLTYVAPQPVKKDESLIITRKR